MFEFITIATVLLPAIIFHEYAHGWVAYRCGDPTAKAAGRLTLNPLKHIDPIGSIILPIILMFSFNFFFGWAKPVPVDFGRLRNPKRDMIWVAMAGPVVNIILAIALSILLKMNLNHSVSVWVANAVFINLLLAVFNMIPIPPLDGSRLVMGLLPNNLALPYSRIERYGILLVFGLLYLGVFEKFIFPVVVYLGGVLGVHLT